MRLIIISPPADIPDEVPMVCRILAQSSATLHLRKPGRGATELATYLNRIPVGLHHRVMVHDHPRLLDRFNLAGIHFSERLRRQEPELLRQLRQAHPGCHITSAFHRIEAVPGPGGMLDAILLSPIFDSISKKGYRAAFDRGDLKRFLRHTRNTVIALGGIDVNRIATAADLGFKGVAVLGAVWSKNDPEAAARQLAAACRRAGFATNQAEQAT